MSFIFKEFLSLFKRSISKRIFQSNWHLLGLDSCDSHVRLKAIKQAQQFGLDMVTLPFLISHALQPLDVSCFKPFQTIFKNESDNVMVRSNDCEPNKCTLVGWVDKALHQILLQKIHEWIEGDKNMATQTWGHGSQDKTKWCIYNKIVNILNEHNWWISLMKVGWSYHTINAHNSYSRLFRNIIPICWSKVGRFEILCENAWKFKNQCRRNQTYRNYFQPTSRPKWTHLWRVGGP